MKINEAIKHCYDRKGYPKIFNDNAGFDISIPGFINKGSENPREIRLEISSYGRISPGAIHYYGNIIVEGIKFSPELHPEVTVLCDKTFDAAKKNPLAANVYQIELVRPITKEELEDSIRWDGYKLGMNTNAFSSSEELIDLFKEVCKARFKGNWKLKVVDYSGGNHDFEILINEL